MSEQVGLRGKAWFRALTGKELPMIGDPASVLTADAKLGDDTARFLCVVPNAQARFPCARHGEVGLEEAYTLAARVREAICSGIGKVRDAGKAAGVLAPDAGIAGEYLAAGASFVAVGTDTGLLSRAAADLAASYKKTAGMGVGVKGGY